MKSGINKIYNLLSIIIIIFLFINCGTEKFVEPEFLNAPFDLSAYPKNNSIKIKFYSNNKEDRFDGFNLYFSDSSSLKSQTSLLPVKNPATGSIPTISRTSKQINPSIPLEISITRDANDKIIENGIRYYIIIKAHSIRNFKSQPSNETKTTPRIESTETITLFENQGFNFDTLNINTPYNFILKKLNDQLYLTAQNGSSIQSKGYYANWELLNTADTTGYVDNTTPLRVYSGYVFLIKTADSKYGKIQIKEMNTVSSYIKITWAFQQNLNNEDI